MAYVAAMKRACMLLLGAVLLVPAARAGSYSVSLEGGPVWQSRNEVEIPNDGTATRFDLADLGTGPYFAYRLAAEWNATRRQDVSLLIAPFEIAERGVFDEDVRFDGGVFRAGEETEATYRFNSYRLGYRFRLADRERFRVRAGLTGKIRDAEIRLEQGDESRSDSNVGFVPLLHLDAEYFLGRRWSAFLDADFLAAEQGRAEDVALQVRCRVGREWDLSAGYRTLEGGADNDSVYTFAWFHYVVVAARWSFGAASPLPR